MADDKGKPPKPNPRTPKSKSNAASSLRFQLPHAESNASLKLPVVPPPPGLGDEFGLAFKREAPPSSTAKSNFRRIAAILTASRKHEEMHRLSPGVRAIVDEKEKKKAILEQKIDSQTGLPTLHSRFNTEQEDDKISLFSVISHVVSQDSTFKTDMFENAATAYVVSDPLEKHYLVESTTNGLYAYFLSLFLLVGVISAVALYGLLHPAIFAKSIFEMFFWSSMSNIILVFLALLWWSLVGNMFLICPRQRDWPRPLRKARWFLLLTPMIIVHVCHAVWDVNLVRLDDEYLPTLESTMLENIHSKDNSTLLNSQSYFLCCGVKDYKDWITVDTSRKYHGGFPPSCCSRSAGEHGCLVPIHTHSKNNEFQLYTHGCLRSERRILVSIVMISYVILTTILISMDVALFHLVRAMNLIIKHDIVLSIPY